MDKITDHLDYFIKNKNLIPYFLKNVILLLLQ